MSVGGLRRNDLERGSSGEDERFESVRLTGCYHNMPRM